MCKSKNGANSLDRGERVGKESFVAGDVERKEAVPGVEGGELGAQEEEQVARGGTHKGAVGRGHREEHERRGLVAVQKHLAEELGVAAGKGRVAHHRDARHRQERLAQAAEDVSLNLLLLHVLKRPAGYQRRNERNEMGCKQKRDSCLGTL